MLSLFRQRNFAFLWVGGLVSITGDWMLRIALPVYVFRSTGSTLATGVMFMAAVVPGLLLSSLAGVCIDRWRPQRTLVTINLLLTLGLLPLLLVRSTGALWIVYLVQFVQAGLGVFLGPVENKLLPRLVNADQLLIANSLNQLSQNVARLAGPALGGIAAAVLGLSGVTLVDAASFLVPAALIALIRLSVPVAAPPVQQGVTPGRLSATFAEFWRQWIDGLLLVKRQRFVGMLFIVTAIVAIGEGVMSVLLVPFAIRTLHGSTQDIGWLLSAQAIGGLTGGIVIARLGHAIAPTRLLGPSALMVGLIDAIIFTYPLVLTAVPPALLLFIVVGLPSAAFGASMATLLQSSVHEDYRGRIFGAQATTLALFSLLGMLVASNCGDIAGIVPIINIQSAGYVAAGVLMLLYPRKPDRTPAATTVTEGPQPSRPEPAGSAAPH